MLTDDTKLQIQSAYTAFLKAKHLRPRYGQRVMIAEIAKALAAIETNADGERESDNHISVIEAGTGTGKTVGYLMSVIPLAQALGKKVVISTATVALQDQIVDKDIPDLIRHSPLRFGYKLAKGRGRYVCLAQMDRLMNAGNDNGPNMALFDDLQFMTVDATTAKVLQRMEQALNESRWDGDRDHWPDELDDQDWRRVTTDHHRCAGRHCSFYDECHFYQARNDLHRAEVVVANHDLVLADLALGGGVVLPAPDQTIYVFDEGHHLPEKALQHFSSSTQLRSTQTWLGELEKLFDGLRQQFTSAQSVVHMMNLWDRLLPELRDGLTLLLSSLTPLADTANTGPNDQGRVVHRFEFGQIPDALREQAVAMAGLSQDLVNGVAGLVEWLEQGLEGLDPDLGKGDAESWYPVMGTVLARAGHMTALWQQFSAPDQAAGMPRARWLQFSETAQGMDVELSTSPIVAAEVLNQYLWQRCYAAVVTSATLVAVGSFERFMMLSGIPPQSQFHELESPFDYPSVASLCVPRMDFDPSDQLRHTQFVVEFLIHQGFQGAVLVLFSSRRQLANVLEALPADLAERVLAQGQLARAEIIRRHKERIDAGYSSVIFGLASFAEGVDLPGDYCRHVVIAKLPFSVPEEPIDATLAEWLREQGKNPFMAISVPDAAIRLKQAVGRLIRTEQDSGRISILDRRLVQRHYGKAILRSLPPIPVVPG